MGDNGVKNLIWLLKWKRSPGNEGINESVVLQFKEWDCWDWIHLAHNKEQWQA
jgi:hypothetical protein